MKSSLVPYSRFSVIKNKKSEECIVIVNLKLPPRHLSWLIFPFTGVSISFFYFELHFDRVDMGTRHCSEALTAYIRIADGFVLLYVFQ